MKAQKPAKKDVVQQNIFDYQIQLNIPYCVHTIVYRRGLVEVARSEKYSKIKSTSAL